MKLLECHSHLTCAQSACGGNMGISKMFHKEPLTNLHMRLVQDNFSAYMWFFYVCLQLIFRYLLNIKDKLSFFYVFDVFTKAALFYEVTACSSLHKYSFSFLGFKKRALFHILSPTLCFVGWWDDKGLGSIIFHQYLRCS